MTYVEGIGDEVLLFFTFVIASFGILLFLFLREAFRRNNISEQGSDAVDPRVSFDDDSSLLANDAPAISNADFQQTPVDRTANNNPEYFSAAREVPNDTENVTEATRSNEQQCIRLRLILQEQAINAQVFYSTTLQDLKRYFCSPIAKVGTVMKFYL